MGSGVAQWLRACPSALLFTACFDAVVCWFVSLQQELLFVPQSTPSNDWHKLFQHLWDIRKTVTMPTATAADGTATVNGTAAPTEGDTGDNFKTHVTIRFRPKYVSSPFL